MNKTFSKKELTTYSKNDLIELFLAQQETLASLNQKMDILIEQLSISNQYRFGRSSEKIDPDEQLVMCFNEAEVTIANKYVIEPVMEEVVPKPYQRIKVKGKREEDLKGLPVTDVYHTLTDDKLKSIFGDQWKQLPDEEYKRLELIPASFKVIHHHVSVYAGMDNQTMVKADRPADLLRNSIVTPSLLASILNSKYINAVPLYRLEQEFKRFDVNLSRQVMANWVIKCTERYLSLLYDRMHQELFKSDVIQADETPVMVSKDGRNAGSKSYMWVYRTGKMNREPAVILYEYQKTRNSSHPETFLKGFKGTLVTDGYQVYHKIAKESPDIEVAGCWSHARRHFANIVKAQGKEKAKGTLAYDALSQIAAIYKIDNELSEVDPTERLQKRQLLVKPLVDAFFAWVKNHSGDVLAKSETGKGFNYCINQECYLRTFLDNGMIPMDNNATESAIRGFCIGKKNWVLIDTVEGAKASAVVYSIAETAKANNLKPYHYFNHILEEISKHMDDKNTSFLESLLPWSDQLPMECKKTDN
jgi:transposase